jgi:hypothetical protein
VFYPEDSSIVFHGKIFLNLVRHSHEMLCSISLTTTYEHMNPWTIRKELVPLGIGGTTHSHVWVFAPPAPGSSMEPPEK